MDNGRTTAGATGTQFKEAARGVAAGVSQEIGRSKDAIGGAASDAMNSAGADMQSLQRDLNGLKDTVTKLMTQVAGEAARSAREVSSNVADRVSDVAGDLADRGADMASQASRQAKTFASELETMARRNPIGALAGAVAVGVLIGLLGRRS